MDTGGVDMAKEWELILPLCSSRGAIPRVAGHVVNAAALPIRWKLMVSASLWGFSCRSLFNGLKNALRRPQKAVLHSLLSSDFPPPAADIALVLLEFAFAASLALPPAWLDMHLANSSTPPLGAVHLAAACLLLAAACVQSAAWPRARSGCRGGISAAAAAAPSRRQGQGRRQWAWAERRVGCSCSVGCGSGMSQGTDGDGGWGPPSAPGSGITALIGRRSSAAMQDLRAVASPTWGDAAAGPDVPASASVAVSACDDDRPRSLADDYTSASRMVPPDSGPASTGFRAALQGRSSEPLLQLQLRHVDSDCLQRSGCSACAAGGSSSRSGPHGLAGGATASCAAPVRQYTRMACLTSTRIKIRGGGAQPEHISPGYEGRIAAVLAEAGQQLEGVYVRRGCIELILDSHAMGPALARTALAAPYSGERSAALPGPDLSVNVDLLVQSLQLPAVQAGSQSHTAVVWRQAPSRTVPSESGTGRGGDADGGSGQLLPAPVQTPPAGSASAGFDVGDGLSVVLQAQKCAAIATAVVAAATARGGGESAAVEGRGASGASVELQVWSPGGHVPEVSARFGGSYLRVAVDLEAAHGVLGRPRSPAGNDSDGAAAAGVAAGVVAGSGQADNGRTGMARQGAAAVASPAAAEGGRNGSGASSDGDGGADSSGSSGGGDRDGARGRLFTGIMRLHDLPKAPGLLLLEARCPGGGSQGLGGAPRPVPVLFVDDPRVAAEFARGAASDAIGLGPQELDDLTVDLGVFLNRAAHACAPPGPDGGRQAAAEGGAISSSTGTEPPTADVSPARGRAALLEVLELGQHLMTWLSSMEGEWPATVARLQRDLAAVGRTFVAVYDDTAQLLPQVAGIETAAGHVGAGGIVCAGPRLAGGGEEQRQGQWRRVPEQMQRQVLRVAAAAATGCGERTLDRMRDVGAPSSCPDSGSLHGAEVAATSAAGPFAEAALTGRWGSGRGGGVAADWRGVLGATSRWYGSLMDPGYQAFLTDYCAMQTHVLDLMAFMSIFGIALRTWQETPQWRHRPLTHFLAHIAPPVTTLAASLLTTAAWPLLPRPTWARLVRASMLPRYLSFLLGLLMMGCLGFDAPPVIVSYHLRCSSVMLGEGVVLSATVVVMPVTAAVMAAVRVPAHAMVWLKFGTFDSAASAVLFGCALACCSVAVNLVLHLCLVVQYRRRLRSQLRSKAD